MDDRKKRAEAVLVDFALETKEEHIVASNSKLEEAKNLAAQRKELDAQIAATREEVIKEAKAEFESVLAVFDLTVGDVYKDRLVASPADGEDGGEGRAAPKYAHKDYDHKDNKDKRQWSGKGAKSAWAKKIETDPDDDLFNHITDEWKLANPEDWEKEQEEHAAKKEAA